MHLALLSCLEPYLRQLLAAVVVGTAISDHGEGEQCNITNPPVGTTLLQQKQFASLVLTCKLLLHRSKLVAPGLLATRQRCVALNASAQGANGRMSMLDMPLEMLQHFCSLLTEPCDLSSCRMANTR